MDLTFALAPAFVPRKEFGRALPASLQRETKPRWRLGAAGGALAIGADQAVSAEGAEGRAGSDSDERLVARIVAGDQRAFAEIVRRHAGRLKALALSFSGASGEADDIVQETFWSLWRHASRWRPEGPPLAAYLARIAVNRAIDMGRRRKVRAFFGLEDAAEVADTHIPADEALATGSELAAVRRDLQELPARQREAILLAADGTTSNAEIAIAMGLTVGAVEQLLVRARRTLRLRLAARDGDDKET
jgi:RNA polymerase sigma-70 factor (ECF subfamily)